jgi:predicted O-methyltransferase YrrM
MHNTCDISSIGDNQPASRSEEAMLAAVGRTGGLIIPAEALALHRLCQRIPDKGRILEIGSYLGASTTAMGHAIQGRGIEMYCLDCWHDYQGQGFFEHALAGTAATDRDILSRFLKNTGFLGEQLRILKGTSVQFRDLLPTGFFDLIFIDAAHDYENVKQDIRIAFKAIKPGGIICGHDYHSDGDGVLEAVNQLIADADDIHIKGVIKGTSIWYSAIEAVRH